MRRDAAWSESWGLPSVGRRRPPCYLMQLNALVVARLQRHSPRLRSTRRQLSRQQQHRLQASLQPTSSGSATTTTVGCGGMIAVA